MKIVKLSFVLALAAGASAQGVPSRPAKASTAANGTPAAQALAAYLTRVRQVEGATVTTTGSLWTPGGRFTNLSTDYKAQSVNDLITIQVFETTQATGSGSVQSARTFNAASGISNLFGQLHASNALQNLFNANSTSKLSGQAQTASSSQLQTSLTGRVVDVLPNGFLVIEAVRTIIMDNQQQTVTVRGVVRPTDIGPDNSVPSTQVGDMEVELQGKGVISDGTRPPLGITQLLLKYLGF